MIPATNTDGFQAHRHEAVSWYKNELRDGFSSEAPGMVGSAEEPTSPISCCPWRKGLLSNAFSRDALSSTTDRWLEYLQQLTGPVVNLDSRFARAVQSVWWTLCNRVGETLRAPAGGPGGELGFQFTWSATEHCLEIDIASDGTFEWFYRDRVRDEWLGSDDDRCTVPPEALVRLLWIHCR